MQRGPSLVVAAVHVGAVLDQELHHVQVVVDASLEGGKHHLSKKWGSGGKFQRRVK